MRLTEYPYTRASAGEARLRRNDRHRNEAIRHGGGDLQEWPGREFWIGFLPKSWFLIVVSDVDAEPVIDAICNAAAAGEPEDGKIFVIEVSEFD